MTISYNTLFFLYKYCVMNKYSVLFNECLVAIVLKHRSPKKLSLLKEEMMKFCFNKTQCSAIHEPIKKEWLLTNGLGGYSSSTIHACNTRKYHGLLIVNSVKPVGRFVLLSTLEESICSPKEEIFFSTRQHPDIFFPQGYTHLEKVEVKPYPIFDYSFQNFNIRREILMLTQENSVLFRYTFTSKSKENTEQVLRIKPQLAFRDMHTLTFENTAINTSISPFKQGFNVQPYPDLPRFYMYAEAVSRADFVHHPQWCKKVQYSTEKARGFDYEEDLCTLGSFEIPLQDETIIYLIATTENKEKSTKTLSELWAQEVGKYQEKKDLLSYLKKSSETFISSAPDGRKEIIAGYPWFQAWGRDTLISLPGICFATDRIDTGKEILFDTVQDMRSGLVPNMFSADGNNSYNTIDASLWFVLAVQSLEKYAFHEQNTIRERCFPLIKAIIQGYTQHTDNILPDVYVNEDGLLHSGNAHSQLTWMDAEAYGKPVTPRAGYAVEINALWYNALAYARDLALKYTEKPLISEEYLENTRKAFKKMFWTEYYGGYLGDVYTDKGLDTSIRPNQLFAVSIPYPLLEKKDQVSLVQRVKEDLLTPYGLRTLSPKSREYKATYAGNSQERDSAYHQGTVWPWLLGVYGDALIKTSQYRDADIQDLLTTLSPLFTKHLMEAGIGSISEICSADYPYAPDGCIAQAWSVSECYRLLQNLQKVSPKAYADWEKSIKNKAML